MAKYDVNNLVPLNVFDELFPIIVEMVYANPKHPDNKFHGLYSPLAKVLWVDAELASIVLVASLLARNFFHWKLKLNDCLRTVEAQLQMANYGYHKALVSKPGHGAHPRGMAIDVEVITFNGSPVEMGTKFDSFVNDPTINNPTSRNYTKGWYNNEEMDLEIWLNRHRAEYVMRRAAVLCGTLIFPLHEEWWDYRMLSKNWEKFEALREEDLHPYQKLRHIDAAGAAVIENIMAFKIANMEMSVRNSGLPEPVIAAIEKVRIKTSKIDIKVNPVYNK